MSVQSANACVILVDTTMASEPVQSSSSPKASAAAISCAERRMSAQGQGFDSGHRRVSSLGAFSRVVVIAVDASDHSKNAFDCTLSY